MLPRQRDSLHALPGVLRKHRHWQYRYAGQLHLACRASRYL